MRVLAFCKRLNTLYKAQGESILNAAGSRSEAKKIYRLVNHLEEQSDNVRESIALLTMIKAKAAAKQGERILLSKTQLLSLMDTVILREWAIIVIPAKRE